MYTNRPPPFAFGFNDQESVIEPIYVKPVIIHAQGNKLRPSFNNIWAEMGEF